MTRDEAPLCWFIDHEMRTLDANAIAVWMAVYGIEAASQCYASDARLSWQLHQLTAADIEAAVATLVERQLLAVSTYNANTSYAVIEPTMLLEVHE